MADAIPAQSKGRRASAVEVTAPAETPAVPASTPDEQATPAGPTEVTPSAGVPGVTEVSFGNQAITVKVN